MDQDKKPRPRILVTFDQLTFDLIHEASNATGLPASHIVNQFMRVHVEELIEFNSWIKSPNKEFDAFARGVHALEQYGPHTLITEMKRIDPMYQPPAERMRAELDQVDVSDLLAMVSEWKAKRAAKGGQR